jgi:putative transposase
MVLKMYLTKKIMLLPTEEQEIKFKKFSGAARFIYNLMIEREKEYYSKNNSYLKENEFRKELTKLKQTEEFSWLKEIGSNVIKIAVKDCNEAFIKFFKKLTKFPKFKTLKNSKMSFYVNYERLKKTQRGFKGEKLGEVKTKEPLPNLEKNEHYINPRVAFDGKYWYLTVSYKIKDNNNINNSKEVIGIDLGIKDFAVLSNGKVYKNINKTVKVKKLKRKLKIKQKQLSKKISIAKKENRFLSKCKNFLKLKNQIRLIHRKLSNIRLNYLHQITSEIVKTKPSKIVIEDLDVSRMLKNRHLSEKISEQNFYKFREILTYKCKLNNIELVIADKFYPSSKTCSCCGHIKQDLKLKDRVFKCPTCGLEIDRDLNAAINLANYK